MKIRWAVGGIYYRLNSDTGLYEVLTVQIPKFKDPNGNMYDNIPGGKVKAHDLRPSLSWTRKVALKRETTEELGRCLAIEDMLYLGRKPHYSTDFDEPVLFLFENYLVKVSGPVIPDGREIHSFRWDTLDAKFSLNLYLSARDLMAKVRVEGLICPKSK